MMISSCCVRRFERKKGIGQRTAIAGHLCHAVSFHCQKPSMLLSPCLVRRFERKKGIGLALTALKELQQRQPGCSAQLVVAGGYDARLAENREHLGELQALARHLGIEQQVAFLPSFSDR
jgi:glycogen synthase